MPVMADGIVQRNCGFVKYGNIKTLVIIGCKCLVMQVEFGIEAGCRNEVCLIGVVHVKAVIIVICSVVVSVYYLESLGRHILFWMIGSVSISIMVKIITMITSRFKSFGTLMGGACGNRTHHGPV